jgi:glycosyltransferase involved in cell wall biosynthesis
LLRNADIICFAGIDWAFNWHLPQEVAMSFADAGNRVLFVENTGVRRPQWKDLGRLRSRFMNWRRATHGVRALSSGPALYSPLIIPLPYSRSAIRINASIVMRTLRDWLGRDRDRPLVVMTFLPTPLVRNVIAALDPDLVVYYSMDRLSESSKGARRLREHEEAMHAEADLVLTTADGLRNVAVELASRVELLHCGVRFADFQRARKRNDGAAPAGFEHARGPVVGFVGSLRNELDLDLIAEAAELASEMTFILVGPLLADVRRLAALPNVRLIGPVPHAEVMRYMVRFDVGILPYVRNEYTKFLMPMKLKEYLAAGLPIVSTHIPEVCTFAAAHPEAVFTFANDPRGFVQGLREAVAEDDSTMSAKRTEVARRYDWSTQMASMNGWIEDALAARRA